MSNYANAHGPLRFKGNSHDITAVELFVNNTAANGIAVKTDKKIKKGRTVTDTDILWSLYGAEYLLRVCLLYTSDAADEL